MNLRVSEIVFTLMTSIMVSLGAAAQEKPINKLPDMSIFHIDGKWKTDQDKDFKLVDLEGKPTVLAMVYTSCQHTCPMVTAQVKSVRSKLPKNKRDKATFVLVTFDPENDTPSQLLAHKKKHKLDEHWVLLTAKDPLIRKLAGVLGVNYKKTPGGGFSHSNMVTLISPLGVVVDQIDGLNKDTKNMAKKLESLL